MGSDITITRRSNSRITRRQSIFVLRQIGYHGTGRNVLSAVVHLDETTPHLQLYYLPIVDEGRKKRIAEEQREKAEEETRELTAQKEKLTKEIAPLSAAAEAFTKASSKKPDKKQIPALVAENARLAKELEYSIKDQTGLFSELQKAERENASLKKDAQTYRNIREHAPDKLLEAMDEAKRRKESKYTSFRGNSSSWTK